MMLTGKVILVVGGAAGIGRATAELCAARGATVIIADIDAAVGAQAAAAAGATFVSVNVMDAASVQALMTAIAARHGRLDALIQAAGILKGAYTPVDEFPLETWRAVMDVNVTGSFLCAKHATPLLKQTGGVIVLISSAAAVAGSSSVAYGASKGGVNGLGITLANKLALDGIRGNVVMPGNIDTGMKRSVIAAEAEKTGKSFEDAVAASRLGAPEGVAKILAWLVSDDADYVRGMISTR
jgi:NAD(P)-dependent dehydrogenase (short-subunit alcohol dehydrogenase family)